MSKIIPKPIKQLNVPCVFFSPYGVLADGMFIDSGKPAKFPVNIALDGSPSGNFGKNKDSLGKDTNFNGCGFYAETGKMTAYNVIYPNTDRYRWRKAGSASEAAWKCSKFNNAITLQDGKFLSASPLGDVFIDASGITPVDPNGAVYEGHSANNGYSNSNMYHADVRVLEEREPNVLLRAPSNISQVYSGGGDINRAETLTHEVGGKSAIAKFFSGRRTQNHLHLHYRKDHGTSFSLCLTVGATSGNGYYDPDNYSYANYWVSGNTKTGVEYDHGPLSSVRTSFYSNITSGYNSGLYRGLPVCRSVLETESETSILFMKPTYNTDDSIKSPGLLRADHDTNGDLISSIYDVVPYNEDGSPFVCEEHEFPYKTGVLRNDYTIASTVHGTIFDHVSKLFEVDGEQYVSCIFLPTDIGYRFNNESVSKNTVQYTFKLDSEDRTRMTFVSKEEKLGVFGKYLFGANTFMFGVNDEMFIVTDKGILTAHFDKETLLWSCSDREIAVPNVRCLYQDEASNLWMMDRDNNLYTISAENSNIVNFTYPDNVSYNVGHQNSVNVTVSVKDLAGNFLAKDLRLEVEGNATFSNGAKTYSVLTSDNSPAIITLILTGYGAFNVVVTDVL